MTEGEEKERKEQRRRRRRQRERGRTVRRVGERENMMKGDQWVWRVGLSCFPGSGAADVMMMMGCDVVSVSVWAGGEVVGVWCDVACQYGPGACTLSVCVASVSPVLLHTVHGWRVEGG
jgi:hypothetical protein